MNQVVSPETSGKVSQGIALHRNPNLSAPKIDRSAPNEVLKKFGQAWWTGLQPMDCKGFDVRTQSLHALPLVNLDIATRQDVLDYFDNTWTLTEVLFSSLKNESTYIRPPYHQLRHPMIFYYGHTAVLFLNKLRLAGVFKEPVDLYLEKVLETGVDEMSWDDMSKNEMLWPSLETVHAYKKKIYALIKNLILTHPDLDQCSRIRGDHPLWALFMGFEHEKIHFETSSVLIRELPLELVETPKYWPQIHPSGLKSSALQPNSSAKIEWVQQRGSIVDWGKKNSTPSYGWDNEYGSRKIELKDFQVTQSLISNGDYFEFVSSLAYTNDKYWSEEGLQWRKFRNTKRPTFWVGYGPEGSHEYKLRTIFEIIDMPWDWPAEVNYHEATAYCHWLQEQQKSKLTYRLITEPEHVSLRSQAIDEVLQRKAYTFNDEALRDYSYNFNFRFSSPSPVGPNNGPDSVADLFGNVWQWAEDQFNPLDGFQVNPLYDDFSTPCFDGKHQMILGGSFISCGHEASKWARFHFRPHFFQHAGFRIAATLDGSSDNGSTKISKSKTYIHPQRQNALQQMNQSDWWKGIHQPLESTQDELQQIWNEALPTLLQLETNFDKRSPIGSALDIKTQKIKVGFQPPYQANRNFPSGPQEIGKILKTLNDELVPLGQGVGHSGYMAYVAGAGNPIANLAQALSQAINQFTGHYSLSPGIVSLESEALNWITTMAGYSPQSSGGVFTSGGSLANLQALSLARNKILKGYDLSKARFYCSEQVHHCIGKALSILGFPPESLHLIPSTDQQAMDVSSLEPAINEDLSKELQPVAIIGTAGSTNTGAVDDLESLATIAKKFNLWFHIDAAYGGFFLLTEAGRQTLAGFEKSDSAALDLHKALSTPYGTGCLIVQDMKNLNYKYAGASSYMPPSSTDYGSPNEVDFADISMELSRDARGLRLWLPMKFYGVEPFKLNLEEKLKLTDWLHSQLSELKNIEFANKPDLSILTFKLNQGDTKALLEKINADGRFYLTGCEIKGHFYIRICLLGFRTHYTHVKELFEFIKKSLL